MRKSSAEIRPAHVGDISPATLAELWERSAREFSHRSALRTEDETLSYREVNDRANRLARLMVRQGAGPDRRVALVLPRSGLMVISVLAVAKTGAAFLPVDRSYPAERVAYLLADAAPALLGTTAEAVTELPADTDLPRLVLDGPEQAGALGSLSGADLTDDERVGPSSVDDVAYVIYTSGSTGRPKGVAVTHRGLAGLATAKVRAMQVDAGSRVLQFASPSFDAFLTEILAAFTAGAELVVPQAGPLVGERLSATLQDSRISHAVLPPTAAATVSPKDFPDLHTLVVAGEACPAGLVQDWAPHHRLINAYGPTEATVCATMSEPLSGTGPVTIGRAIPGVEVHILDGRLRPVPAGETGDLYISGAGLARGYLGRPGLTAERFVANPLSGTGTRMYRTGDLASWQPDGTVLFHGRNDDQVKLRGFRIELGEVEAVLASHPDVEQAVTVLRNRPSAEPQLVAYVIPRNGAGPSAADLREHALTYLPDFMVPAVYSTLDALPLTPNGKVDRAALPEPAAPGRSTGKKPRTSTEEAVYQIFTEIFATSEIDVESNFFELGGTSILAIEFIQRAEIVGLEFAPRTVLENPTIAGLAATATRRR